MEIELSLINIDELEEHPQNKEFFPEMTGQMWYDFLEDVARNGITSPLTINEKYQVVKGNQRLRAARELGMKELSCIYQTYDNEEDEIDDLIRDNVMRRQLDPFTILTLTARIMKHNEEASKQGKRTDLEDDNETSELKVPKLKPTEKTRQEMNVGTTTVTAARRFDQLSEGDKEMVKIWAIEEGAALTQKALNEKVAEVTELRAFINKNLLEGKEKDKRIVELERKLNEMGDYDEAMKEMNRIKKAIVELQEQKADVNRDFNERRQALAQIQNAMEFFGKEVAGLRYMKLTKQGYDNVRPKMRELLEMLSDFAVESAKAYGIELEKTLEG